MGVIKHKFSLLAPGKVAQLLKEEVAQDLAVAGVSDKQIDILCLKITLAVKDKMKGEYTVMGGYPPNEQLLSAARALMHEMDERDELEALLEENDTPVDAPVSEPSEPELEDAYHVADSIQFVGSEKQVNWARSIATNNSRAIAQSGKFKSLPTAAKWWIENRDDLYSALAGLP
ncbi:MAG: hypothetical protein KME11_05160 [Timaviella obliquedivisa GSE-PSE-MK23-08B]|jgi:hypothetical protein|nr:hypothetical protein [Timaviella obliquedivisa GSE-PSE-MK23-08B]